MININSLYKKLKMSDITEGLKGKWVILYKGEIIEQNDSMKEILELAESKYKDKVISISRVPSSQYCFF